MDAAQSQHDKIVRGLLLQHGGYEIATEGDSFTCSFEKATHAVSFATALHQMLDETLWPAPVADFCFRFALIFLHHKQNSSFNKPQSGPIE